MNNSSRLFCWLFYLWLILILIVSSLPGNSFSNDLLLNWDKLGHFIEYYILLALFVIMQLSRKADPGLLPLILLIVILPVIEESHQLLIPGRSFSIFDIFADIAGAFSAFITYKINEKKIRSRFNSL